jgi:hypothetical protein
MPKNKPEETKRQKIARLYAESGGERNANFDATRSRVEGNKGRKAELGKKGK